MWLTNRLNIILAIVVVAGSFQPIFAQTTGISWRAIQQQRQGVLPVYWYESRPFIFKNANGQLAGIEYELINDFTIFLQKKYGITLEIQWIEAEGFDNVLQQVTRSEACFGVSAFSITNEREARVAFSPPYMSDIMVMVSHGSVPETGSAEDFIKTFGTLKAITIRGTTYERELLFLREKFQADFEIDYIPSALNILETIQQRENTFGFIDLPIYLMYYSRNPNVNIKRQNFYPVKRKGYGFLMPKMSDWAEPVYEYFEQANAQTTIENMIGHYLDIRLYQLNEQMAKEAESEQLLEAKEREIQKKNLEDKNRELVLKTRTNYLLAGLVGLSLVSLVLFIFQYNKRNQQASEIKRQQQKIELRNTQLEARNNDLSLINEEKNTLIKILAHDMRSPLNQVQGLSQVLMLSSPAMAEHQIELIKNIQESAQRLNKMITNILDVDAIESGRINMVKEDTDICALVVKVTESFQKQAVQKNIGLEVQFDKAAGKISADALYLTLILENLLSNAIKFSPIGKAIRVLVTHDQDKIKITVIDQGPGFTLEDKNLLFKKFKRLNNRPTNGEPSIGLGLSIVKQYTEMMGGHVWCDSEAGMGAAFHLEFDEVL
jgi:signal transduction histidine kinase